MWLLGVIMLASTPAAAGQHDDPPAAAERDAATARAVELDNRAKALYNQRKFAEAEPLYREALAIFRRVRPAGHPHIATSLNNLARLLQEQHRLAEAEPLYREALTILRAAHPAGHPSIATSLNNLASLLQNQNKLAEAEPLYREALKIDRAAHPAGHPDIATSLNNLAGLLHDQNKLFEAEPLFREALKIARTAHPAGHPSIATSLNNLASLLQDQNKLAESEPLYREALTILRAAHPAGHPSIATSLNNLASLLQNQNKLAEAEPLYREALEINRKAHPAGHPDIATSLGSLAMLLRAQNKLAEAEPLYREALEIDRNAHPAGHPSIATKLSNLALLISAQNKLAEAEPLFREALKIDRAAFPAGHPYIATSLINLASLLQNQNNLAEAEPLYREALAIRRKSHPAGHPSIATSLNGLAGLLQAQNKLTEAEPLFREALKIDRAAHPAGHPSIATSLNNLAGLLQAQNKLAEAEALYREALKINRAALPGMHPDIALSLNNLAMLLQDQNKLAEAEPLYREALAIRREALPAEHPYIAQGLSNLAVLSQAQNKLAESEALYREALKINRAALPEGHPSIATRLNNLAMLLQAQNKLAEAEPLMREALVIFRKAHPAGHTDIATSLNNLARLLHAQNKLAEAEPLCREALAMRRAALPEGHPYIATSLNNLAMLLQAQNKLADAEPLYHEALAIYRKALPAGHPAIAIGLNNLAVFRAALGEWSSARTLFVEGVAMEGRQVRDALPRVSGADRVRSTFELTYNARALARLALAPGSNVRASDSYIGLLGYKGLMTEASRAERAALFALAEADPAVKPLLDEQGRLQGERAALASPLRQEALTEPQMARLRAVADRLVELERQLRDASPLYAEQARLAEISVKDVAGSLKPGQALVEYAVYRPLIANPDQTSQRKFIDADAEYYAAFVLRSDAANPDGFTVTAVDLGKRKAIDDAVAAFRSELEDQIAASRGVGVSAGLTRTRERKLAVTTETIRTLVWDPLKSQLAGVTRVYVSPEARLHKVPFEALPTGKDAEGRFTYLAESTEILYQVSGRELARARLTTPRESSNTAVLVGNPLFSADSAVRMQALATLWGEPTPAELSVANRIASTLGGGGAECVISWQWTPLPGTGEFIRQTATMLQGSMAVLPPLTGAQASKLAFQQMLKRFPRPRVVQLATHGFFCTQAPATTTPRPSMGAQGMLAGRDEPMEPDPMLRSMLILAGADVTVPGSEDNGLLSATEVMAIDLRGTELVGLTACHSGQGELQAGEGVAGLRTAFAVAGAKCVLQSLWEVPTDQSLQQTEGFYTRWLKQGRTRYGAFREAQLEALAKARETTNSGHAWLWAGFTFAGDPGDLPRSDASKNPAEAR